MGIFSSELKHAAEDIYLQADGSLDIAAMRADLLGGFAAAIKAGKKYEIDGGNNEYGSRSWQTAARLSDSLVNLEMLERARADKKIAVPVNLSAKG